MEEARKESEARDAKRASYLSALRYPLLMMVVGVIVVILLSVKFSGGKLSGKDCKLSARFFEDNAAVVTDAAALNTVFTAYYEATGVQPYLYTFKKEAFPAKYGELNGESLSKYGKQLYADNFDDEGHWLIVFCVGENTEELRWGYRAGGDTTDIVSYTGFENSMKSLLAESGATPQSAVVGAMAAAVEEKTAKKSDLAKGIISGKDFLMGLLVLWEVVAVIMAINRLIATKRFMAEYEKEGKAS